jgi:Ser/Thr protein kinase RdoA (MazF antagonist)
MDRAAAEAAYLPAAAEALRAFPIRVGEVAFVTISENVTFRVTDAEDGERFVLRLHRPGYHSFEALSSERIWTRALAQAGIGVPPPVNAVDGRDYVPVAIEATGERRWAGLARWIDGQILGDVVSAEPDMSAIEGHFGRLGALLGVMHNQASAWTPPPAFTRHALDEHGLMGEAPFWGPFWDHTILSPGERTLLLATREKLHAALIRLGKAPETYGVIHADLHPGNVVIDGERLAVIDFDDAAFGWHHYDLAVALVFYQDHANFAGFRDALIAGYRAVRPLPEAAVGLLPMFLLVRNLVQMGWLHQRPEIATPADYAAAKASIVERAERFTAGRFDALL